MNCDINHDDCSTNPCKNGGVCIDGIADYTCQCVTGFLGSHCLTNIDDCINVACGNGTCVDGVNSYHCECHPGFEGKLFVYIYKCLCYSPVSLRTNRYD